ncbi:MAG: von Willebrand factor type A domain-containing protein [Chloroflexi bacterium]|nr:von Willebrand factor type A domain-containing protein [Chloroflexota bacterium]
MNAKRITFIITICAVLLTACAAPTTQAPEVAKSTQAPIGVAPSYPTSVPAATYAPQQLSPRTTATAPAAQPQATAPADNTFKYPGLNPFVDTSRDHLSTFGLDVDTASYTVARRYVKDGNLPPAESIRVEEFVNYFKQDYAAPPNTAFAIFADGAPSPYHRDGSQILRVGIQGYTVPDEQRKPANLVFVIDISGSMQMENRLGLVKKSLEILVEQLRDDDTVGIVVFGTTARVLLNPTPANQKGKILEAIYALKTEGATNAEAGIKLGYDMANKAYRPDGINRVILCSDGVANTGQTNAEKLLETIKGYAKAGITLSTFGFGMGNFNDALMERLANGGDGNYAYIDDLDEAKRQFITNLTSNLQVIALNAKVQVDFNQEVVSRYRLIGYENRTIADKDFRNNAVDAGEIGAGHTVTALYAVQLKPAAEGRIATVQLRWEDPQTHVVREINGNYNTFDLAKSFDNASLRYQLDVVVMQYAEILRRSPYAEGYSMSDLKVRADRLAAQLKDDADVIEFAQLVNKAATINKGW